MACGSAAEEPPYGLAERVPWAASRLAGSPEPPLDFTVAKVFEKIALRTPVYVAEEPQSGYLLVVLTANDAKIPSQVLRFKNDPAVAESEVYFELPGHLLYSIVFHPEYVKNRQVFLFSNGPTAETERTNQVARYTVKEGENRIAPESKQVIIQWRSMGHDGGDMAFGLDRMLYITSGDGTSDSDTWNSGQTLDDLLGGVLRIDVDHPGDDRPYSVPPDNPFVNTPGARGEIWAYGLRNPWRMCIDPGTGHLWVGNNGQDLWETAHLVRRGDNLGWSVYEGNHPFYLGRRRGPTPLVPPTIEHHHSEFRSLTGGVVYYGEKFPELAGAYIYGDYSSGRIWGMKHDGQRVVWHRELADTPLAIAGFGATSTGDLLVVDHGGSLCRLVRAPRHQQLAPFPARLSETGLFASVADHRAADGVIPYSVNASGWHDGATAERFIAIPGDARIGHVSGAWNLPDGTALVQTLSHSSSEQAAANGTGTAAPRRIETRVLLRQQGEWAGYSYRWNDEQNEAYLVPRQGAEAVAANVSPQTAPLAWRFPSRSECMVCHSRAANFVLGFTEAQLNREHDYPHARDNQLRALAHIGLFAEDVPKFSQKPSPLVDPQDTSHDLEARARSYLHVNCAVCHVMAGGGNARMELGIATPLKDMQLVGARPQHDTLGIENAMLVAPGEPDRSVLVHRLSRRGPGQMPPLVSHHVDTEAVQLMREWISQLRPARTFVRDWRMEDLVSRLDDLAGPRSLESGKGAFRDIGCADCHRFDGSGSSVGPDLTGIGKRLKSRELLESILLPSKTIADEYAVMLVATDEGRIYSGRIEREDSRTLVLRPNTVGEALVEIPTERIIERHKSDRSNMPSGTLNVLHEAEILDLLGYLQSEASTADPRFR